MDHDKLIKLAADPTWPYFYYFHFSFDDRKIHAQQIDKSAVTFNIDLEQSHPMAKAMMRLNRLKK